MNRLLQLGLLGVILYVLWEKLMVSDSNYFGATGGGGALPDQPAPAASGDKLSLWARLIQTFESGGDSNALNYRNNNPGNIRGGNGEFLSFDTPDAGMAALKNDLKAKVTKYPDWTLEQIMARYLGQSGNPPTPAITNQGNPFSYAAYIAQGLGVKATDTLRNIFGG